MNDDRLDELVAAAAPPVDAAVSSPGVTAVLTDIRDGILTVIREDEAAREADDLQQRRAIRSRRIGTAVAAAAALVVIVAAVVSGVGSGGSDAYAADVVAVAERSPRLLIDRGEWAVVRADEFAADQGETTFSDGTHVADLMWRPARTHDDYVNDRQNDSGQPSPIVIAGVSGNLYRYSGTDDFTALWLDGDHSLELRIDNTTEEAFRAVVEHIVAVDVNSWLDALPESVVRPGARTKTAIGMLSGVPVPDGFDRSQFDNGLASDEYQLGAQVVGAVVCAWLEQWNEADRVGDERRKDEAASALATAAEWQVLLDMNDEGDYPEVVWEYASLVAGEPLDVPEGSNMREGPYVAPYDEEFHVANYWQSLGCRPPR